MKISKKFAFVRKQALTTLAHIYDPFHDHFHAIEVEKTALEIFQKLSPDIQKKANSEDLQLLALLHDTSREIIGTNLFLEPLLGGYLSASIAYKLMIQAGYSDKKAQYILYTLRNHEAFYGLWHYKEDVNEQILADADLIEQYSPKRLQRGLRYFQQKKFSLFLFNIYIGGLIWMDWLFPPTYNFSISEELYKKNLTELKQFFIKKKKPLGQLLYQRVFRMLYASAALL